MPSRREQVYIGIAASAAFAVVVAFLQIVVGLGALAVIGVGGFVLLYFGFLLVGRSMGLQSSGIGYTSTANARDSGVADPVKNNERGQKVEALVKQRAEGLHLRDAGMTHLKDTMRWKAIVDEWDTETQAVIRKFSTEEAAYFAQKVKTGIVLEDVLFGVKFSDSINKEQLKFLVEKLRRLDEIIGRISHDA